MFSPLFHLLRSSSAPGIRKPSVRARFGGLLLAVLVLSRFGAAQALTPGGPTDFGSLPLGGTETITFSFSAGVPTTISSVVATTDGVQGKDFTILGQNCTGVQSPPASCTISLGFSPTQIGLRRGALSISDGSGAVVNRVFLHGIGIAGQLVFGPLAATTLSSSNGLSPAGVAPAAAVYDPAGNVYFDDIKNGRILKQDANGNVSTLASVPGTATSSMAISGVGTLYISSPSEGIVYSLAPGGTPTPITTGSVKLVTPSGLATDGVGYLYITDAATNKIIRVSLDGTGTTTPLTPTGITTPLLTPLGVAVDDAGNLYIADSGNDRIVKMGLYTGKASVVAVTGFTMLNPHGLSVDAAGTLTIADTGNSRLIVVPPTLAPYVLATPGATLSSPTAVLITANASVIVADPNVGLVTLARASAPVVFPTSTKVGYLDTTDGTMTFLVQNVGNLALQLPLTGAGFSPNAGSAFIDIPASSTCPVITSSSTLGAATQIALGAICTYGVQFKPTNTGDNTANFTINASDAAGTGITMSASQVLTGTGFSSLTALSISGLPPVVAFGPTLSFTITALAGSAIATDYLGTVSLSTTDLHGIFPAGATYTFTAADAGVHTFVLPAGIQFNDLGTYTVTVADNKITATSGPIQVLTLPLVSITSLANPILIGNSGTLVASVAYGAYVPTGTVTFFDGKMALGTTTLNGGFATLTPTFNVVGAHSITASYSGDTTFAPTVSVAVIVTVVDFTITAAPTSSTTATIVENSTVSYTFAATPIGGGSFPSAVAFSVSGLPTGTSYVFSPAGLDAGSQATNFTLTITAATLHSELRGAPPAPRSLGRTLAPIALAFLLPLACIRRRRRFSGLALLVLLTASLSGLTGCLCDASSGYAKTAPTTASVVQVTATSGLLTRSTTVTLNVQ